MQCARHTCWLMYVYSKLYIGNKLVVDRSSTKYCRLCSNAKCKKDECDCSSRLRLHMAMRHTIRNQLSYSDRCFNFLLFNNEEKLRFQTERRNEEIQKPKEKTQRAHSNKLNADSETPKTRKYQRLGSLPQNAIEYLRLLSVWFRLG